MYCDFISLRALAWPFFSGIGLWLVTAFINHSSSPNAEYCASGDTGIMMIRAKHFLKAGSEITVSYVEERTPDQPPQSLKMWGISDDSRG